MKLLGFCDWYAIEVEYKGKRYPVEDINTAIFHCKKPSPSMITLNQLKLMSEKEQHKALDQKDKEWAEYKRNPWGDGLEEMGKELEVVREECWKVLEKVFIEKGWRYPGCAYQDEWVPVIEDDKGRLWKIEVTQRMWGAFIYQTQCAINNIEPNNDMGYMDWYLTNGKNNSVKPKYPRKNWVLQTTEYERDDELI